MIQQLMMTWMGGFDSTSQQMRGLTTFDVRLSFFMLHFVIRGSLVTVMPVLLCLFGGVSSNKHVLTEHSQHLSWSAKEIINMQ